MPVEDALRLRTADAANGSVWERMGDVSRAMKRRQTAAEACAQDVCPQFHPCWWVTPEVLPGANVIVGCTYLYLYR